MFGFRILNDVLEPVENLLSLLGTILIGLLSGAGGSVILEVLWRPSRSRRRAAALVHSDLIINAQLVLAHAELRKSAPRKVPQDLILSRLGFDTAEGLVAELPPELLRKLVGYYNLVNDLNRNVGFYADALDLLEGLDSGSERRKNQQRYLNSIIDVWNTGLDNLHKRALVLLPELERLAKIKSGKNETPRDIAAEARALMARRAARLRALDEMDRDDNA